MLKIQVMIWTHNFYSVFKCSDHFWQELFAYIYPFLSIKYTLGFQNECRAGAVFICVERWPLVAFPRLLRCNFVVIDAKLNFDSLIVVATAKKWTYLKKMMLTIFNLVLCPWHKCI